MLKENTFAVVVVGEVRDKERGQFLNFVGDTITMFMDLGLHYYNEFIYITPVGTLGIRTRRQFPCSRKAGKTHQTVLCFWKGEPKHVRKYVDRFRKSPFILPVSLMAQ